MALGRWESCGWTERQRGRPGGCRDVQLLARTSPCPRRHSSPPLHSKCVRSWDEGRRGQCPSNVKPRPVIFHFYTPSGPRSEEMMIGRIWGTGMRNSAQMCAGRTTDEAGCVGQPREDTVEGAPAVLGVTVPRPLVLLQGVLLSQSGRAIPQKESRVCYGGCNELWASRVARKDRQRRGRRPRAWRTASVQSGAG